MKASELLEKITTLLSTEEFFRDFKFQKSNRFFISKNGGFRKDVRLPRAHYYDVIDYYDY